MVAPGGAPAPITVIDVEALPTAPSVMGAVGGVAGDRERRRFCALVTHHQHGAAGECGAPGERGDRQSRHLPRCLQCGEPVVQPAHARGRGWRGQPAGAGHRLDGGGHGAAAQGQRGQRHRESAQQHFRAHPVVAIGAAQHAPVDVPGESLAGQLTELALAIAQGDELGAGGSATDQHHTQPACQPAAKALHGDRHVPLGDLQRRRHLCSRQSVAQVQVEHFTVVVAEPICRRGDQLSQLGDLCRPCRGEVAAHRFPRVVVPRAQVQATGTQPPTRHFGAHDRVDPWPELGVVAELRQALHGHEEHVVRDVAGVGAAAGEEAGVVVELVGVPVVQRGDGSFVTGEGACDQRSLVHSPLTVRDHRRSLRSTLCRSVARAG